MLITLIEEMINQAELGTIAPPERIPLLWIPAFFVLFIIIFFCKTIIDKLWKSSK